MFIKLPIVMTSEGISNKRVLEEMAQNLRDGNYRHPYNGEQVVLISVSLADQLADFFDDMAKAID